MATGMHGMWPSESAIQCSWSGGLFQIKDHLLVCTSGLELFGFDMVYPVCVFTVAHLLSQTVCDLSLVCLSSIKLLPLHPAHAPHTPFIQTPCDSLSPIISSVWWACPEAGSDHPPWNAFRCWNRWHWPTSMNKYLLGRTSWDSQEENRTHKSLKMRRRVKEAKVEVALGFFCY